MSFRIVKVLRQGRSARPFARQKSPLGHIRQIASAIGVLMFEPYEYTVEKEGWPIFHNVNVL